MNDDLQRVVLVAGFDYMNPDPGDRFDGLCMRRIEYLLAKRMENGRPSRVEFHVLSFSRGSIFQSKVIEGDYGPMDFRRDLDEGKFYQGKFWVRTQSFGAVTKDHYTHEKDKWKFISSEATQGLVSVINLYEIIGELGMVAPRSVVELGFFSYSGSDGPRFVNSEERREYRKGKARDPWDHDARSKKDFMLPKGLRPAERVTVEERERQSLLLRSAPKAFSGRARIWIWGAAYSESTERLIRQTLRSFTYVTKQIQREELVDDDVISPVGLKGISKAGRLTWMEVRDRFNKSFTDSYAQTIANAYRTQTLTPLPGTREVDEMRKDDTEFPLLIVPQGPPYQKNYEPIVNFFQKHFERKTDGEKRNYGAVSPTRE